MSGNVNAIVDAMRAFAATATPPVVGPTVETPTVETVAVETPPWLGRPDACGHMGWERPGLPEADRWWARQTFEQLPTWREVTDRTP